MSYFFLIQIPQKYCLKNLLYYTNTNKNLDLNKTPGKPKWNIDSLHRFGGIFSTTLLKAVFRSNKSTIICTKNSKCNVLQDNTRSWRLTGNCQEIYKQPKESKLAIFKWNNSLEPKVLGHTELVLDFLHVRVLSGERKITMGTSKVLSGQGTSKRAKTTKWVIQRRQHSWGTFFRAIWEIQVVLEFSHVRVPYKPIKNNKYVKTWF